MAEQQVVELNGYVIIVVEGRDNKIKLYGSPADKDNLEVGDEILDVNERKLEDLPRAEVIRYIHEVRVYRAIAVNSLRILFPFRRPLSASFRDCHPFYPAIIHFAGPKEARRKKKHKTSSRLTQRPQQYSIGPQ